MLYYDYKYLEKTMKISIKSLTFPEQVKTVRIFLQLTQTELAEQIGVSYATISRWER